MFSNFFNNSNQKEKENQENEDSENENKEENEDSENENEEYENEEYEDSENEENEDSEDSENEDNNNLEAMLKLQYNGALDEVKKWKKKAEKWEKKYDKQKVSNKKLKEQLDESRFSIETIDGKIRYKSLEEIKNLTIYDDQRPINKKHVQGYYLAYQKANGLTMP